MSRLTAHLLQLCEASHVHHMLITCSSPAHYMLIKRSSHADHAPHLRVESCDVGVHQAKCWYQGCLTGCFFLPAKPALLPFKIWSKRKEDS